MEVSSKHFVVFFDILAKKAVKHFYKEDFATTSRNIYNESFWADIPDEDYSSDLSGFSTVSKLYFLKKYYQGNNKKKPVDFIEIDNRAFSKALKLIGFSIPDTFKGTLEMEAAFLWEEFKSEFSKLLSGKSKEVELNKDGFNNYTSNIIDQNILLSSSNFLPIPSFFFSVPWTGYERITNTIQDSDKEKKDTDEERKDKIWGMYKFKVEFEPIDKSNLASVSIKIKFTTKNHNYLGVAAYDKISKCIFIHLRNQSVIEAEKDIPAFYFMPVHDEVSQELSIGYVVYYSNSFNRLIAKTVIWQNSNLEKDFEPTEIRSNDIEEFKDIPKSIKRYLFNQSQNRLILPNDPITYLNNNIEYRSLSAWINKRTSVFESDRFLLNSQGKYSVCYYFGDSNPLEINQDFGSFIQVDDLEINYESDEVEYNAHYKSKNESGFDKYNGIVRHRDSVIQVILEEEDHNAIKSNVIQEYDGSYSTKDPFNRFGLLSFNFPNLSKSALEKHLESYPFFTGILTGINQFGKPVSYIAVIVKSPPNDLISKISKFDGKDELISKIIQFFRDEHIQLKISVSDLPKI